MPARRGRKRKHFTIPKHLLEARRAGKVTLEAIAEVCGVSARTIARRLRQLGLLPGDLRGGRKPKDFTIPEHLLERRRAGQVTLEEMAQVCGVSVPTLARKLRRLDFPHVDLRGEKPDIGRRRQAAALRAQGLTLQEIGRRLGISRQGAAHLLKPPGERA